MSAPMPEKAPADFMYDLTIVFDVLRYTLPEDFYAKIADALYEQGYRKDEDLVELYTMSGERVQ